MTIGLICLGLVLLLAFLRVPLGIALLTVSVGGIAAINNLDIALTLLPMTLSEAAFSYELAVVPLFILMGNVLSRTGISAQTVARGAGTALRQSLARALHPCPPLGQVLKRYRERGRELELLRQNALHGIHEAPFSWAMAPDRPGDSLAQKFFGRLRQVLAA